MSNRDLINDLKERIEIQVEDTSTAPKLEDINNKTYEKGFIRGYISSINYVAISLKQNNIIGLDEFVELNEFIADSLDKVKEYE